MSAASTTVVGIYGLPGSGKTTLLKDLKRKLGEDFFTFYEGSQVIEQIVPGGLQAFQQSTDEEKEKWRKSTIDHIHSECAGSAKTGVVTGHYMLWSNQGNPPQPVITQNDLRVYSHILYLDVPAVKVFQRRYDDTIRHRESLPVDHLDNWQQTEKTDLRNLCRQNGILFMKLPQDMTLSRISSLMQDFRSHSEVYNLLQVERKVDAVISARYDQLQTVFVFDADRTLTSEDTSEMFWDLFQGVSPLKVLFSSPLGYSYTAFRQATLLYEEAATDEEFESTCEEVSVATRIHPEFITLFRLIAQQPRVCAIVVTCGLQSVWERVLKKTGLSDRVEVVGSGRINNGLVITPEVKRDVVDHLQSRHGMYVWVFGDNPIDLPMLQKANRAVVVVGNERTRSTTMDGELAHAIEQGGLQAQQALVPMSAVPRLDTVRLPLLNITGDFFIDSAFARCVHPVPEVLDATKQKSTNLLMTPTRDASVAGPLLRKTHQRIGEYLAIHYLPDVIGLEKYPTQHVQGRTVDGYRLLDEAQTLIVAMMRGGEPMALGVNEIYPLAMFLHAKSANDIKISHIEGMVNIVLVDSVINTGKSMMAFVRHIRKLHATIRIVIVANVVHQKCVSVGGPYFRELMRCAGYPKIYFVVLRISQNQYAGQGSTDTGNRLFNTTMLA
ncbi:uracil phosphoribosyltransferase-domain-containing protein [Talaromyces proteolyticus]|uniref:Uracil phosphoribosyltransferase-domain-containing protein n=1 Tax=Talaromyces proteolyticus TaxID=1131652 RepID=A0AAD4Q605_9EURO|nr:uracil phosphoribosyltransferase-domain-containing protein [Talaromyces proteolyticus]KAH8705191.1 uracil phosphoribosyltransferase-domain-containing protein [Talaromyces proteolyticus]